MRHLLEISGRSALCPDDKEHFVTLCGVLVHHQDKDSYAFSGAHASGTGGYEIELDPATGKPVWLHLDPKKYRHLLCKACFIIRFIT